MHSWNSYAGMVSSVKQFSSRAPRGLCNKSSRTVSGATSKIHS